MSSLMFGKSHGTRTEHVSVYRALLAGWPELSNDPLRLHSRAKIEHRSTIQENPEKAVARPAKPATVALVLRNRDDSNETQRSFGRNRMGRNFVKPHLQSLILANQIFQDKESNNFVIAGTFNRLQVRQNQPNEGVTAAEAPSLPQKKSIEELRSVGSPWLFFSLTDIVGKVPCSIRYVYLHDNQVLFSTEFMVESNDRLATLEHRMPLPTLPFVGFGQYAIEFLAHDEMIGSLRIMAVAADSEAGEQKHA